MPPQDSPSPSLRRTGLLQGSVCLSSLYISNNEIHSTSQYRLLLYFFMTACSPALTALFTAGILSCQSGKSTGVIDQINDGCILFRQANTRDLILCTLTHCHGIVGHLTATLMLLFTHVLFLLWLVNTFVVKRVYCRFSHFFIAYNLFLALAFSLDINNLSSASASAKTSLQRWSFQLILLIKAHIPQGLPSAVQLFFPVKSPFVALTCWHFS